jgi:hypothetical protein
MQPDNRTWDPGRVQDHKERNKLCKLNVPDYLYSLLSTVMMVSAIDVSEEVNAMEEEDSRTELDSHANMPVVGRNAYIISDTGRIADMNLFTLDYDKILHSEVSLQLGENMTVGKVTKCALGPNSNVAGTYDENPCLNLMTYEVEFPDGQLKEYAANVSAENMLTQVDSKMATPSR